ncbi:glycosylphosphatidylinositol-alpha 1,2 mannosyltransferase [Sporobolomyces salmoneus]|uniref:glycosylphosphatidylinositol-alpha 1,2 mannosyltransferase n=1 Tax=Sporobolomyces salmoneus TaxID=183962 RepID=UPI0031797FDD
MYKGNSKEWRIYLVLIVLRILIGFTSRSTIHPDEHFQNPEIAVGFVFDYGNSGGALVETWEWQGTAPCRSIAPLWISSGAAFSLVKALIGHNPSAETLFFAQRAATLFLSFIIDLCVYRASRSILSLLLFASAPVTLTFLVRPFSNSIETVVLAIALYLTAQVLSQKTRNLIPLGAVLAFGIWTRITFIAFSVLLVMAVIWFFARQSSLSGLIKRGSPAIVSFFLTAYLLSAFDTLYFRPESNLFGIVSHPSLLIVTPLNLLKYNLSSSNLAEHGLHPRYLHALVNLPMLFGVGILVVVNAIRLEWRKRKKPKEKNRKSGIWNRTLIGSLLVPVALLSIQPHQEPRFLVPLIVPLVLLASESSFFVSLKHSRQSRRVFWSLWIVHSLFFTLFFGYLHQGGLVPTLLQLNRGLGNDQSTLFGGNLEKVELVFWKTFMPPRHLLLPLAEHQAGQAKLRKISITDLGGTSLPDLYSTLSSTLDITGGSESPGLTSKPISKTFLVAPSYVFDPSLLDSFSLFSRGSSLARWWMVIESWAGTVCVWVSGKLAIVECITGSSCTP